MLPSKPESNLCELRLKFNHSPVFSTYKRGENERDEQDAKTGFLAQSSEDKNEYCYFSTYNFKLFNGWDERISEQLQNNGQFAHESNENKAQLHVQLTALAGALYKELAGGQQPIVRYAVDENNTYFTASRLVKGYLEGGRLSELCDIKENQLHILPDDRIFSFKNLLAINLVASFLNDLDVNEENWGVILSPSSSTAQAIKIDTENCFNFDFFEPNKDNIKKILSHPLKITHPVSETNLSEIYSTLHEHFQLEDDELEPLEKAYLPEAVVTLFNIISTPDDVYKKLVEEHLNLASATAYKTIFSEQLIANKKLYAMQALSISFYLEEAQKRALDNTSWLQHVELIVINGKVRLKVGPSASGYCPLMLFKTNPDTAFDQEEYNQVTIHSSSHLDLIRVLETSLDSKLHQLLVPRVKQLLSNSVHSKKRDRNDSDLLGFFTKKRKTDADQIHDGQLRHSTTNK